MIELFIGITAGIVLTKKLRILEKIKLPNIPKLPKFKVIVKINDDKYAIRRGYIGCYEYYDLTNNVWQAAGSRWFKLCLGTKKEVLNKFQPIKSETVVDL